MAQDNPFADLIPAQSQAQPPARIYGGPKPVDPLEQARFQLSVNSDARADASAQRTTLGLGTIATATATDYAKVSGVADIDMNDYKITEIKTATFKQQGTLTTTTGAVTIDWTAAQNYKQNEPTGGITYTFTAPPGVCHLQLLIDSDGTSTAQTITWPGTVVWVGSTWAGTNNKKAIINFWYDGTNYFAQGANQV